MKHSSREDQRPAVLWFWDDWFSSADIKLCSLAAQGLWINMLGLMSRAEIKGALLINGKQIGSKELAILTGKTEGEINPLLDELETYGVYDKLSDGTIINRRMYREAEISRKRADAGRLGGQSSKQSLSKNEEVVESKMQATLEDEDEYSSLDPLNSLKEGDSKGKEIESEFSEFWEAYPWKEGKQDALRAYQTVRKTASLEEITSGVNGYLDYLKSERIKNNFDRRPKLAATLLRNDRWREYIGFKYNAPL